MTAEDVDRVVERIQELIEGEEATTVLCALLLLADHGLDVLALGPPAGIRETFVELKTLIEHHLRAAATIAMMPQKPQ